MIGLRSQRGSTLLIAMIMLVLLTLFALSALRTSSTNLKAVGNMQARSEALNAAQLGIETAISTPLFTTDPANAVLNPCDGTSNKMCADASGALVATSTNAIYTIQLTPQPACIAVRAIKTAELSFTSATDKPCFVGQPQNFGVAGAVSGDSLCASSEWEMTAAATSLRVAASR